MSTEREAFLTHFLLEKGAHYEEGRLTGFNNEPELKHRRTPVLSVLDQRGLLEVSGPDTTTFLQGQLTCHVQRLQPAHYQRGSVCTAKGRMYANFTVLNTHQEQILMAMHAGLLEDTKRSLEKYAVFFKADITIKDDSVCLGLSGDNITPSLEKLFGSLPTDDSALQTDNDIWLIPVDGATDRLELWLPQKKLSQWWDRLTEDFTPVKDTLWRLLDIEAVTPSLTPETRGKYIPQHLNQPSLKAVSFRKGCYTGQEIVARMQNLGQLKSRCYRLKADQHIQLTTSDKLYNSKGKSIGEVFDSVNSLDTGSVDILAVIRVEAAENNDVVTETGIPLNCLPLPYTVNPREELQF